MNKELYDNLMDKFLNNEVEKFCLNRSDSFVLVRGTVVAVQGDTVTIEDMDNYHRSLFKVSTLNMNFWQLLKDYSG